MRKPFLLALLLCLGFAVQALAAKADFKLRDLNNELYELSAECEDGYVLLSFWATWCEPCKLEIPHLIELQEEFAERGLKLALVSVDSPRSQRGVAPYARGKGWTCPVLLDTNGKQMKKLKGTVPPFLVIVNPEGEVVYSHSGYKPGDEKHLQEYLDELLPAIEEDANQETPIEEGE